jgi:hypothetical protein
MLSLYSFCAARAGPTFSSGTRSCTKLLSPPFSTSHLRLFLSLSRRDLAQSRVDRSSVVPLTMYSVRMRSIFFTSGAIERVGVLEMKSACVCLK